MEALIGALSSPLAIAGETLSPSTPLPEAFPHRCAAPPPTEPSRPLQARLSPFRLLLRSTPRAIRALVIRRPGLILFEKSSALLSVASRRADARMRNPSRLHKRATQVDDSGSR